MQHTVQFGRRAPVGIGSSRRAVDGRRKSANASPTRFAGRQTVTAVTPITHPGATGLRTYVGTELAMTLVEETAAAATHLPFLPRGESQLTDERMRPCFVIPRECLPEWASALTDRAPGHAPAA